MHPTPANAAAGLLVAAALGLVVLTLTAAPPRPPRVDFERPAVARESAAPAERPVRRAPSAVVAGYYRNLDTHRFGTAWHTLTPELRAAFGAFDRWREGYVSTVSSRPLRIRVARRGRVAEVTHVLAATDRTSCGLLRRRFTIRWRLVAAGRGWRATSLTSTPYASNVTLRACKPVASRHAPPRPAL